MMYSYGLPTVATMEILKEREQRAAEDTTFQPIPDVTDRSGIPYMVALVVLLIGGSFYFGR